MTETNGNPWRWQQVTLTPVRRSLVVHWKTVVRGREKTKYIQKVGRTASESSSVGQNVVRDAGLSGKSLPLIPRVIWLLHISFGTCFSGHWRWQKTGHILKAFLALPMTLPVTEATSSTAVAKPRQAHPCRLRSYLIAWLFLLVLWRLQMEFILVT